MNAPIALQHPYYTSNLRSESAATLRLAAYDRRIAHFVAIDKQETKARRAAHLHAFFCDACVYHHDCFASLAHIWPLGHPIPTPSTPHSSCCVAEQRSILLAILKTGTHTQKPFRLVCRERRLQAPPVLIFQEAAIHAVDDMRRGYRGRFNPFWFDEDPIPTLGDGIDVAIKTAFSQERAKVAASTAAAVARSRSSSINSISDMSTFTLNTVSIRSTAFYSCSETSVPT